MKHFLVHHVTILLFAVWCGPATAEQRVALVVGNSAYENVPSLSNPRNDAEDISAALQRLDFDVTRQFDLNARALNIALRDFSRRASEADMAIVYYAGHGMEIDNTNYLLPVDAVLERASDVAFEATDMNKLLRSVWGAKKLRLVLLDACRDNPFLRRFPDVASRSTRRGLGEIEPTAGVLVGYSARGGTVALDGDGRNSPYAEALLAHLEEPGLEIGQMFRRVRDSVLDATGGQQEPFIYGSLPASSIYFRSPEPQGPSPGEALAAFLDADAANSPVGWSAFLDTYRDAGISPGLIARAEEKLALLTTRRPPSALPAPRPTLSRRPDEDPMIRACDQLAADPDDPGRPSGVSGVAEDAIDTNAAMTACTLASAGYPDHGRSHYNLARVQMAAGQLSRSGSTMLRASELGYTQAGLTLGIELISSGTAKDRKTGFDLLLAASDSGSPEAPRVIGDFLASPASLATGVPGTALEYYSLAAERGDIEAMYQTGYRLVSASLSKDADVLKGLEYLEAAARDGHSAAERRLVNFHLMSEKSSPFRDTETGIRWLTKSAGRGSAKSARQLAAIYQSGDLVAEDIEKATKWIEVAAIRGDPVAILENAYNWETGRGKSRVPAFAAQNYYHALNAGSDAPYRRVTSEWDRETVRSLQELLRKSGISRYRGPTDGLVGPGTRAAMARLCGCPSAPADISLNERFGN